MSERASTAFQSGESPAHGTAAQPQLFGDLFEVPLLDVAKPQDDRVLGLEVLEQVGGFDACTGGAEQAHHISHDRPRMFVTAASPDQVDADSIGDSLEPGKRMATVVALTEPPGPDERLLERFLGVGEVAAHVPTAHE